MPETEAEAEAEEAHLDPATLPAYYNAGGEDLIALAFSLNKGEHFCSVNIAKYLLRYDRKNGLQDLCKARVYLDRLISHLEQKGTEAGAK